jgi:hypothetical protein
VARFGHRSSKDTAMRDQPREYRIRTSTLKF